MFFQNRTISAVSLSGIFIILHLWVHNLPNPFTDKNRPHVPILVDRAENQTLAL
jgi:hypothetical protein